MVCHLVTRKSLDSFGTNLILKVLGTNLSDHLKFCMTGAINMAVYTRTSIPICRSYFGHQNVYVLTEWKTPKLISYG